LHRNTSASSDVRMWWSGSNAPGLPTVISFSELSKQEKKRQQFGDLHMETIAVVKKIELSKGNIGELPLDQTLEKDDYIRLTLFCRAYILS